MALEEAVSTSVAVFVGRPADVPAHASPQVSRILVLEVLRQCEPAVVTGSVVDVATGGYDQQMGMREQAARDGRTVSYPARRYERPLRPGPADMGPWVCLVVRSRRVDFQLVADGALETLDSVDRIRALLSAAC
jgi:hypothetical protein